MVSGRRPESIAFYIYSRSFFLPGRPVVGEHREGLDYSLGQARSPLLGSGALAHVALVGRRAFPRPSKQARPTTSTATQVGRSGRRSGRSW